MQGERRPEGSRARNYRLKEQGNHKNVLPAPFSLGGKDGNSTRHDSKKEKRILVVVSSSFQYENCD